MEHETNISHYLTVGVVALFPGLRRFIGVVGLLGMVVFGLMGYSAYNAREHRGTATVNTDPVCDRMYFRTLSQVAPPEGWGPITVTQSASGKQEWYVREARGSGWCMVKHDKTTVSQNGMYGTIWSEAPSKYGQQVQANAVVQDKTMSLYEMTIMFLFLGSAAILFGIWLPATIWAAVGRRFLRDVKEEPL